MIKAIIFDVGGVLKTQEGRYIDDIKRTLALSDEDIARVYRPGMRRVVGGECTEQEHWKLVLDELGKPYTPEVDTLLSRDFERYYVRNEEVISLAKKLKRDGYQMAILSNTCPSHSAVNARKGVYDDFDIVILSFEVKLQKPDPRIFQLTLGRLHVRPEEAVFIDDVAEYAEVATTLGMHGIHFTDYGSLLADLNKLGVTGV